MDFDVLAGHFVAMASGRVGGVFEFSTSQQPLRGFGESASQRNVWCRRSFGTVRKVLRAMKKPLRTGVRRGLFCESVFSMAGSNN